MNKIMKTSEWKPVDNIIYNEESAEIETIKSYKNCLVPAGPGAGKTELLAQKASFLLQTNNCAYPRKILALSFKVDAADNIKKRVEDRCGEELSSRFISRTYDSFFKNLLDRFLNLLPGFYRPSIEYNITSDDRAIIKAYESSGLDFQGLSRKDKSFYKEFYLTENSLPIVDSSYGELAKKVWPILLRGNKEVEPQVSFKMIARLVEYIIKENPILKKSLGLTYSHVFLDEFQDTNHPQYSVIKACFQDTDTIITAVGDKKQRIMEWAGAMQSVFEAFKLDFNAEEKTLLINHRSAPKLIKLQNIIVEEMLGSKLNIEPNETWSKDESSAEIWSFKNEDDEAEFLCKKIEMLVKEQNINKKEICILTRMLPDNYCDKLISKLPEVDIEARVENYYQDILREDIVKIILSIVKLAIDESNPDEWLFIVNILKKINRYTFYTKSEKINLLEKDISIYLKKLNNCLCNVTTKEEFKEIINNIVMYLGIEHLRSLYSQYRKGDYIDKTIEKFLNLFWNDYIVTQSWNKAIERFKGEYTIPIMSIHKSKGLEFNTIIMLGVEGSAFWGIRQNPSEELCNFFVAVSRAKENLFFTYSNERIIKGEKKLGDKYNVKLFYDLMNKSEIVMRYNFTDNFKQNYLQYYSHNNL